MSNWIESLENMVKKPKKAKKPANAALWFAYAFFNIVILIFDVVAAATVYAITKNEGYAVITFLAGFVPLMLHEFLYLRAYASQWQRGIAVLGAACAFLTVVVVALLSAIVNLVMAGGAEINIEVSRLVILVIVVGAALLHVVLTAVYFYIDEGIRAGHIEAETTAYYDSRLKNINRAETLIEAAEAARHSKARIIEQHGGADGKAALDYILNLLNDDDGDGIPNIIDPVDNRKLSDKSNGHKVTDENFTNR